MGGAASARRIRGNSRNRCTPLWLKAGRLRAAVVSVASVSDQPSNAASEFLRTAFGQLSELDQPPDALRASVTDDFAYEDRRRGPSFPNADAESITRFVESAWETGAGRPQFVVREILGVRGDRFAAGVVDLDYGNGMMFESIHVIGLDDTLSLMYRSLDFDVDDIDGAIAELDRLQSQADAS
jgi:hypothetical protein